MTSSYTPAGDLGIVTCYFNPFGFRRRAENFEHFVAPLKEAGMPLVIVEGCFPSHPGLLLPERHRSLKVPARDLMWQKERLLDLGVGWLPDHCTKVAWLDADVLFERPDWAVETSRLLDEVHVMQPFSEAVKLGPDRLDPQPGDDRFESFGAVYQREPQALIPGKWELHGHTGFAWAARRDLLGRHGLYDVCISGSGDHMMAHTFARDWDSPCVRRMLGTGGRQRACFRRWSRRINEEVQGQLSFIPGRVFTLWHGSAENRRYLKRNQELIGLGFDPEVDIRLSDTGCWEWASDKPELHAWASRYFIERKEDEDPAADASGSSSAAST